MTKDNEPTHLLLDLPEPTLSRASRMAQDAGMSLEEFVLSALEEMIADLKNIPPS